MSRGTVGEGDSSVSLPRMGPSVTGGGSCAGSARDFQASNCCCHCTPMPAPSHTCPLSPRPSLWQAELEKGLFGTERRNAHCGMTAASAVCQAGRRAVRGWRASFKPISILLQNCVISGEVSGPIFLFFTVCWQASHW